MRELETPLKKYLKKSGENLLKFSIRSRLPLSTVYRIVYGKNTPSYVTARRISTATKNELTLESFGYPKKKIQRLVRNRRRKKIDQYHEECHEVCSPWHADSMGACSGDEI